jgi:hypothetical protein
VSDDPDSILIFTTEAESPTSDVRRGLGSAMKNAAAKASEVAVSTEALADKMPVDAAVAEARKAISLAVANTVEWGTPVLYMRSPNGVLFRIKPQKPRTMPQAAKVDSELPAVPVEPKDVPPVRAHRYKATANAQATGPTAQADSRRPHQVASCLPHCAHAEGPCRASDHRGLLARWGNAGLGLKRHCAAVASFRAASESVTSLQALTHQERQSSWLPPALCYR